MRKEAKINDIKDSIKTVSKRIAVNINSKAYPCYFTMGAALTFKDLTGRDTTEMDNGLSDFAAYLYACCKSACSREKKEFPFEDVQQFADGIDGDELSRLSEAMITTDDSQKKE